jgi:hypothetical protein
MYSVNDIEQIGDNELNISYPYVELKNIKFQEQFKKFLIDYDESKFYPFNVFGAFGEKQGRMIMLGHIVLTSKTVLYLNQLGIDVVFHQGPAEQGDLSNEINLIKLCTNRGLYECCF